MRTPGSGASAGRSSTRCAARSAAARSAPTPSTTRRLRLPRGRRRRQRRQRPHPVHDRRLPQHQAGARRLLAGRGRDGRHQPRCPSRPSGSTTRCRPTRPTSSPAIAVFGNPSRQARPAADDAARCGVAGPSTCATPVTRSARPTARTSPRTGPTTGGPRQPGRRLRRGPAVAAQYRQTSASIRRLTSAW